MTSEQKREPNSEGGSGIDADFTISNRRVSKDERDLIESHKDMQKALI